MEIGRSDLPLAGDAKDALGLNDYARALAMFVRDCETPMTIGIQGEWGSGKTSLMNMVMKTLPKGTIVHWFNTWQYGALGDDETLGLQLISTLAEQIVESHGSDAAVVESGSWLRELGQRLSQPTMTRAVVASLLGVVPGVDGGEVTSVIAAKANQAANGPAVAAVKPGRAADLQNLRGRFAQMVEAVSSSGGKKPGAPERRFVIFIDDLDRIRPEHAVTLLEVLKNFLDVPNCVFVIACDYEVVRRGVETKFGITDTSKVRAFFDKIVQVPFQMPIGQYKVDGLLRDYLRKRGVRNPLTWRSSSTTW